MPWILSFHLYCISLLLLYALGVDFSWSWMHFELTYKLLRADLAIILLVSFCLAYKFSSAPRPESQVSVFFPTLDLFFFNNFLNFFFNPHSLHGTGLGELAPASKLKRPNSRPNLNRPVRQSSRPGLSPWPNNRRAPALPAPISD
jgi:hypothetical protein